MFANEKYYCRARKSDRPLIPRMLRFRLGVRTMVYILNAFYSLVRRDGVAAILAVSAIIFLHTFAYAQGGDTAEDAVAIFNKAQEIHEKGDLKGAIELYEKALKIVPEFPEAEYQRGSALLSLGNALDAEKAFRRAVELRPDWTLAMTSLGSILVDRGQYDEAEKILTKAIDLDPQNFPAFAALVDLRLKTKAPVGVLKDLLAKITSLTSKANPTPSLWAARAALENALGSRDSAKSSLARALAIDPRYKTALMMTADIAIVEGDAIHAAETVDTLEKIAPNTESVKLLRARTLLIEGKDSEALALLDSIPQPSGQTDKLRTAIIAGSSTDPSALEKQLDADPKNAAVLGRLCMVLRVGDPVKALGYCRRAAEAEPTNINHAIGFAAALVRARQFDAAVIVLKRIINVAPDNWTAHANLATALFELQRYADAKPVYQWLIAKQPNSAAAYYLLGIVHDRLSEYMDAMANYQQYLKLADTVKNKLDIDKVNLRLPTLQRQIKEGKGKKKQ